MYAHCFRSPVEYGRVLISSPFVIKIVITTYQTLCGDFPKRKKKVKNLALEQPDEDEVVLDDLDAP